MHDISVSKTGDCATKFALFNHARVSPIMIYINGKPFQGFPVGLAAMS